jgi:RNA polymerase sigma-70 factor (ECF subfamily)
MHFRRRFRISTSITAKLSSQPGWRELSRTNASCMRVKRRTSFVYLDETLSRQDARPKELPARGPDPEGEFAFEQIKQILNAEIRRVPPLFRNVMLLRDVHGWPLRDVANQLGITVPAAKSRLLRARAEMRRRMLRHSEQRGSTSAPTRCVLH